MSALEQAARMALEALSHHRDQGRPCIEQSAYDALRAALDAGQAQPVAWITEEPDGNSHDGSFGGFHRDVVFGAERPNFGVTPLYASPPARQPLTDEQIADLWAEVSSDFDDGVNVVSLARAIERAHGIGATP